MHCLNKKYPRTSTFYIYISYLLLDVKLGYEPVCPSIGRLFCWSAGCLSVMIKICLSMLLSGSLFILSVLYPFSIEFNILVVGVWYILWSNIGNTSDHQVSQEIDYK